MDRITKIIERIVALGIALVLGYLIYQVYTGKFEAQFASAIGSLGLVIATFISLLTTRTTLREQRKAREQNVRPVLKLDVKPVTLSGYAIVVKNVGNGLADNIELTIKTVSKEEADSEKPSAVTFELPIIESGDYIPLSAGTIVEGYLGSDIGMDDYDHHDDLSTEEILYRPDLIQENKLSDLHSLHMNGICEDMLGNEIRVSDTFNPVFTEEGMAVHMNDDNVAEKLSDIDRRLDDIGTSIDRMNGNWP